MNRSSSKRGKASSRFQFDITVDRVLGTKPGTTYYVKWMIGAKNASTKQREANQIHSRTGLPFELEKLSLHTSLYRDDGARTFDEKPSKISFVAVNTVTGAERTVTKIHFNLADFAGVPSSSTTKAFKLSEKVTVKTLIEARFLRSGKSGPGSGGARSTLSAMTGLSGRSSNDDDDDDDFDDLNIDDVPEPVAPSKRQSSVRGSRTSSNSDGDKKSKRSSVFGSDVDRNSDARDITVSRSKRGIFGKKDGEGGLVPSRSKRGIFGKKDGEGGLAPSRSKRGIFGKKDGNGGPVVSRSKRALGKQETVEPSASKRGLNALRPRQKRDSENEPVVNGVVAPTSTRPRSEKRELDRLRSEHEQMTEELRRSRDKQRRMETLHAEELEALRLSLGTARGVATADDINNAKMSTRVDELEGENSRLKASLDQSNREQESLRSKAADVDKLTRKNRELTAQLDKATAAAASRSATGDPGAVQALEERLARTRKEKELLENKIQAHKAHAEKVRDTYERLSSMYSNVREENIQLQQDLEQARAAAAAAAEAADKADRGIRGTEDSAVSTAKIAALEAQLSPLQAQVRSANARAQDADAIKVQTEAEVAKLRGEVDALQMKLEKSTQEARHAKKAEEELRSETGELKNQRDAALKRALSKRGNIGLTGNGAAATLSKIREEADREVGKARTRLAELEEEVQSLEEDVVYERGEKQKAREERDALRESVRQLERRTSEAALQQDSISGLRRKLSTQQMREEDLNAMVAELRAEVKRLESQNSRGVSNGGGGGSEEDEAEMLGVLVKTKLELAQAEDEKLELMWEMKQMKRKERAIQDRLAAHASNLEVKLGEAREQIESLRLKGGTTSPVSDM